MMRRGYLLLLLFLMGCGNESAIVDCPAVDCPVCDCSQQILTESGKCTEKIADALSKLKEEELYEDNCITKPSAKQQELSRSEIMKDACYMLAAYDTPENEGYTVIRSVRMKQVCLEKGTGEILVRIIKDGKQLKYLKTDVQVHSLGNVSCDRIISFHD